MIQECPNDLQTRRSCRHVVFHDYRTQRPAGCHTVRMRIDALYCVPAVLCLVCCPSFSTIATGLIQNQQFSPTCLPLVHNIFSSLKDGLNSLTCTRRMCSLFLWPMFIFFHPSLLPHPHLAAECRADGLRCVASEQPPSQHTRGSEHGSAVVLGAHDRCSGRCCSSR